MNRLMQNVVSNSHGTGRSAAFGGWPIYAKTGTTDDNKDVYFAGGTPYYVGACWFGYDHNQEMNSSQTQYARNLWRQSMEVLHSGLEMENFDKKGTTQEHSYCATTGKLATSGCPVGGVGVYKAENVPGYCTVHGGSIVDEPDTPEDTTTTTTSTATTTTTLPQDNPFTTTTTQTTTATSTTTTSSAPNTTTTTNADAQQDGGEENGD